MKYLFFLLMLLTSTTIKTVVIEIDGQQDLDNQIKQHAQAVVKFYRPGCPHCKVIQADYEAVSNLFPDIAFLAVNTDKPKNKTVFPQWGIEGVPTLFFVKKGERTEQRREPNFRASFERAVRAFFSN